MKAPTTRDRPAPRRRALRRRWAPGGGCGACSCGLLAGGTQDVPLHIRPEVLATDGSACGALDCRAVLCRDSAACHPVRHRRWSNANGASKGAFRSENFSSFCERFHAHSLGSARAHAATFRLSAGLDAFSLLLVISCAWYCRPSGTPVLAHSQTLAGSAPRRRATFACDPNSSMRS